MTWSDISNLFVEIEVELIESLRRNLKRHVQWESKEGFRWPAWQAEKLKNMEAFRIENQDIIGRYASVIDNETATMLNTQYSEGMEQINQEAVQLKNIGTSYLPFVQHQTERSFFGVDEPKLQSLIQDVQHTEQKAESAVLRMMDDVYRQTVYKAEIAMASGAANLPKAIDMATEDFLRKGIDCIEYRDGRRVNISDYVQMALRTAATRSYLQGEAKRREELGIDTVLVSQYGACSNTCLPWQGRVYIDDVWGNWNGRRIGDLGESQNGQWYPLLSVAVKNGLFHPNCRHTLSTWYEGISTKPKPMDKAVIRENSKLEQKQRELEKDVRMWKRMEAGAVDPETQKRYASERRTAQKRLRDFVAEHDDVLRREYWREKIRSFPTKDNSPEILYGQPKKKYAPELTMDIAGDKLNAEDIYAIDQYKKSGVSYALNAALRRGSPLTDIQRETVNALDQAMIKLPDYQGIVYRSIIEGMIEDLSAFWERYAPGNFVLEQQYVSSSTEVYDKTMEIQMIIQSKHGKDMRIYNPSEQEILFCRGTMFFVEKREENTIWLTEV